MAADELQFCTRQFLARRRQPTYSPTRITEVTETSRRRNRDTQHEVLGCAENQKACYRESKQESTTTECPYPTSGCANPIKSSQPISSSFFKSILAFLQHPVTCLMQRSLCACSLVQASDVTLTTVPHIQWMCAIVCDRVRCQAKNGLSIDECFMRIDPKTESHRKVYKSTAWYCL